MKKRAAIILMFIAALACMLCGCQRQSDRVAYNISKEADNFNVTRRLEVINARTDKPAVSYTHLTLPTTSRV